MADALRAALRIAGIEHALSVVLPPSLRAAERRVVLWLDSSSFCQSSRLPIHALP